MAADLWFSRPRIANDEANKVDAIVMMTSVMDMPITSSNSEKPDWLDAFVCDLFIARISCRAPMAGKSA
jgi:hypothetical protein